MTIATIPGYDAIGANVGHLPAPDGPHVYFGYATGTGDVPWTAEEWARYPGAVRIDQTPQGGPWDRLADVDDYETGAVELGELAPRARERLAAFRAGERPGQRAPAVYASESNLTAVCNALVAGGVASGVGLAVAHWGLTPAAATAMVANASGPFPVIACQYANGPEYDTWVVSLPWLSAVSAAPRIKVLKNLVLNWQDGTSETVTP